MIDCIRGCGQKYQRRLELKHVREECLFNEINCDFCGLKITKLEESAHLNSCPKFPIPCPANCGLEEIKREDVCVLIFRFKKVLDLFKFNLIYIRFKLIWRIHAARMR